MKRFAVMVIVIFVLLSQMALSTNIIATTYHMDDFQVNLINEATTDEVIIQLEVPENINQVAVELPEDSEYSVNKTEEMNNNVSILYDEKLHELTIETKKEIYYIVITNLSNLENVIYIKGMESGSIVSEKNYSFSVQESKSINDDTKRNNQNNILIFEEENDQKNENENEMQTLIFSTFDVSASSSNLNVAVDLSPHRSSVLSGNAAFYKLVLKVTGSRTKYTDAKITVDLPITDYTEFTQDLNDLAIDNVVPVYDTTNHQLIYQFDELQTGRTYETEIKVNTINGISPHNAQLIANASFEANEQASITDDATISIDASSAVSISKKYKETRLSGNVQTAPFPGSYTIWDIKVSIPKKDVGQMFLKEGAKIVITDTFSNGLTFYDVMGGTPEPNVSGRTLSWEFDAPTLQQQMEADGELFTIDLRVRLQVNNNASFVGTTQTNSVQVQSTFINDEQVVAEANDSIPIITNEAATGTIIGSWYVPVHHGPIDEKGGIAPTDNKNPDPIVYSDALLGFSHGIAPLEHSKHGDFQEYKTIYKIDPYLHFEKLTTPRDFQFRPNATYPAGIPLAKLPTFDIKATINGSLQTLVTNAELNRTYTRSDLGLSDDDHVSEIYFDFTYAPWGMLNVGRPNYYFTVKDGYTGSVQNTFNVYGVDARGVAFNQGYDNQDIASIAGPRTAQIAPRPSDQPPIASVSVELLDHEGGEIIYGENRLKVTLNNSSSSTLAMMGPLESVVLLPPGVTISNTPNAIFTDENELLSTGSYEVIDDNYNGSGRQLIKFTWNENRIGIGNNVTAELDVIIGTGTPNSLIFDVYGFSGEEVLGVPSSSNGLITDTVLQTDTEDLNDNGETNEPRLKSGNIYTIRGQYDIQTEKLVKGELDEEFSHFGHTKPSGAITYQLKLTNTTGSVISKMTLIDVLPSVGDLGITDNIERGSQFTPKLNGPITLPTEWEGKVNVFYSTAKNPKRDDLTKNTIYPETTMQLTNPEGAEEPNWHSEDDVQNWADIHSFKIELKENVDWIEGDDITIVFAMEAPSEYEVSRDVIDPNIEPTERAAWNSFAVATDHGQPVEPVRVGVYMDYEIEEPKVEKSVNGSETSDEVENRNDPIIFEVDYDFGNYTANWESVVFQDQVHELLDIVDVKVVIKGESENDIDVSSHGTLDITNNLVTFTLDKQDGSFAYLKDQIYTLIIETKIKEDATDEELEPFIHSGGIPNTAQLIIDNDPINSNEVKIKPPVLGEIHIVKIAEETAEKLEGATFELWKCTDENSVLDDCAYVEEKTSDENGELSFIELPLGYYKLVETKAPEGYRILTKPIDIEILDAENRIIEMEIANSESGWELPHTGGIGTAIFYGIGLLLITSGIIMLRNRKNAISKNKE